MEIKPICCLVVEDDPAILLGLEDYLLAQSFDVIKSENISPLSYLAVSTPSVGRT